MAGGASRAAAGPDRHCDALRSSGPGRPPRRRPGVPAFEPLTGTTLAGWADRDDSG